MKLELPFDRRAGTTFPLIILFGVLLAWMMAFIFISIYDQQMNARVDEQAKALADDLARTAFTALSGGQPTLDLPRDLGGSTYAIEVQDSTFIVKITAGRRAGSTYNAVVNATVTVVNKEQIEIPVDNLEGPHDVKFRLYSSTTGADVHELWFDKLEFIDENAIEGMLENFEDVSDWTYSEEDSNAVISGSQVANWAAEGTYSYKFTTSGAPAVGHYAQIVRSFDLTGENFLRFWVRSAYTGTPRDWRAQLYIDTSLKWEEGVGKFNFTLGGRAYFLRSGDQIIVSATSIEAPVENIDSEPTGEPPQFYYFARDNQREGAAIAAAYFEALGSYPGENVDASAYRWENADSLLVQVTSGGSPLAVFSVAGSENSTAVGKVENAWIVDLVENAADIGDGTACSSPDNAYRTGWLYSPQGALGDLRSRTWQRVSDNVIVAVPADATLQASAATTNVYTYPTWRVTFEGYVIFYRMVPWWTEENMAGFVFQSEPELSPVV